MAADPCIILIDGEHYPPVIARAVDRLKAGGLDPLFALLVGGGEKLDSGAVSIGIPVRVASDDPEAGLLEALEETGPVPVIDLSDEPVLADSARFRMASVALYRRAPYRGAGFSFTPPPRPVLARVPSISIIGSGKRTGKTALAGAAARLWSRLGLRPAVVAMGRGGPADPEVISEPASVDAGTLLGWVDRGRHAASDYIEDALTARVPTVGAWRAGGGVAGAVDHTNFPEAVEAAHSLDVGLMVMEGSGASIPPVHTDASVLVVSVETDPGSLCGYFGLYRLLLADLVVLTMVEQSIDRSRLDAVTSCIRNRPLGEPRVVRTVFRPKPLQEVRGKRAWLVTTAPEQAAPLLLAHLRDDSGAEVLGSSHTLADRAALRDDLAHLPALDVLLVELKAAAVDVVARFAEQAGIDVVFVDNEPREAPGEEGSLEDALVEVAALARERFRP